MSTGNNIRKIRQQRGMTLQQLANILECSQQNISQYENEKRMPKLATLQKIAIALNVNINDLLETPLDDSPAYRTMQKNSSPLLLDYKNSRLTEEIDCWEPIDIELIKMFKTLNDAGQVKALERVEELTEIPRYTAKP